ncbi:MAG TPA: VIT1/CCC1 transporter family protein [Terriglobales bacterium]|nr:VIT1/CCC1 transporter family protein [Terriglobales bacterium]
MPSRHIEKHFTASDTVRDIVIGMSDGLTVPFALAAGLAGAVTATGGNLRVIVIAGLAEIAAGSTAMGLGGYLAARGDAEHYEQEREREEREIIELPHEEEREVAEVLQTWGLTSEEARPVVKALAQRPKAWVDFMMRFELALEEPQPGRALRSAATIASAYVAGGLIPLAPYMLLHTAGTAFLCSIVVTLAALGVFGAIKGHYTGTGLFRSASQTLVIGALAAMVAFLLARWIS